MRKILLAMGISITGITATAQTTFTPPKTPAIPVIDTLHGMLLTDNYRWLEDKTDAKVIEWTKTQHDYGIEYLQATQKTHAGLREDIAAYIDLDYEGPLDKQGKRVFQNIKRKGDKQNKLYTILDGQKILIWDPVQLDTTGSTATTSVDYTYDGERAAISVQKSGGEISTTYIIDTRTGKTLYAPLQNIFNFQWTRDQQHAYFTIRTQEDVNKQQPLKTYWLELGDPVEKAIDCTHRIGQTKNIFAYRMICKDTVEDKILLLQDKKKALAADLITDDTGFVKSLTREDIEYLFS